MNIKPLKQSIIKETVIFTILIVMCAVGLFFLDSWHTELDQRKNVLQAETNNLLTQRQTLEANFKNVQENMNLYKEVLARIASPGMYIDRLAARDIFNIYRSQFFFKKLVVDMNPVSEVPDPGFSRPTLVGTRSDVRITFEAASDDEVYALIRVLPDELPGFTKITQFNIRKAANLNEEAVLEIRSKGSAALVTGTIDFSWYGVRSPDPKSSLNKVVVTKRPERRRRRN